MREQVTFSISDWEKWILDAIRKIRAQKQRPSSERICHAVRQHHPHSEEVIKDYLEQLVSAGTVLKVFNKGQNTYKDPGGVQNSRQLKLTKESDLTKVICRATRELREKDGSTLKSIEKYIQQSHSVELSEPDVDLSTVIRQSAKRAVDKGLIVLDGKLYKAVEDKNVDKLKPKKEKVKTDSSDEPTKPDSTSDKPGKSEKTEKAEKVDKQVKTPKSTRKKRSLDKSHGSAKVGSSERYSVVPGRVARTETLVRNSLWRWQRQQLSLHQAATSHRHSQPVASLPDQLLQIYARPSRVAAPPLSASVFEFRFVAGRAAFTKLMLSEVMN
ncbi:hypothetical protein J6590_066961 [Homalodisca vitripennis]|nr:hypothetical protein J6590_066961 [Homalodisca vitripennis]